MGVPGRQQICSRCRGPKPDPKLQWELTQDQSLIEICRLQSLPAYRLPKTQDAGGGDQVRESCQHDHPRAG